MCKGIKDLFLVIYRNHLHHLHPLWVISVSSLPCLLSRNCTRVRVHHLAQCLRCRACAPLAGTLFLRGFVRFRNGKRTKKKNKRKRQREYGSLPNKGQCQKLYAKNAKNIVEIFSSETFFFCLILFNRGLTRFDKIICTFAHRKTYKS